MRVCSEQLVREFSNPIVPTPRGALKIGQEFDCPNDWAWLVPWDQNVRCSVTCGTVLHKIPQPPHHAPTEKHSVILRGNEVYLFPAIFRFKTLCIQLYEKYLQVKLHLSLLYCLTCTQRNIRFYHSIR